MPSSSRFVDVVFSPPDTTTAAGCTQLLQYGEWVNAFVPLPPPTAAATAPRQATPKRPASASSSTRKTSTLKSVTQKAAAVSSLKQRVDSMCESFRDGTRLAYLAAQLPSKPWMEGVPPTPTSSTVRASGPSVARTETARLLKGVLQWVAGYTRRSLADLPTAPQLYAGNAAAIGQVLFHLFDIAVVQDRYSLAGPMLSWYKEIAAVYGRDVPFDDTSLASLGDGMLLTLAFHNTSELAISLDTVFEHPSTPTEINVSMSFAFAVLEAHDIFVYFDNVKDVINRRSDHFWFMQCFAAFERLCDRPVRVVDRRRLQFAEPLRQRGELIGVPHTAAASAEPMALAAEVVEAPPPKKTPPVRSKTPQSAAPVSTASQTRGTPSRSSPASQASSVEYECLLLHSAADGGPGSFEVYTLTIIPRDAVFTFARQQQKGGGFTLDGRSIEEVDDPEVLRSGSATRLVLRPGVVTPAAWATLSGSASAASGVSLFFPSAEDAAAVVNSLRQIQRP